MVVDREPIAEDPIIRFLDKFADIDGVERIVIVEEGGVRELFLLIPDDEWASSFLYANVVQVALIRMIGSNDRELLELTTRTRLFDESGYKEIIKERGGENAPERKVEVLWERPSEAANPPQA